MRALVADDDRVASAVLSRTLTNLHFDVTSVGDGAEAYRFLQTSVLAEPTLAILDWMMPHLDGPEVCRRVRRDLPLGNMYLILLTSMDQRRDVIAGLEAGADDYVIKPFDPEELRARVQVGVRVLHLQKRLAEQVSELQTALSNVKQLQGLLPICSYCKRIRADGQYWTQVESYIAERSDAQFSHGICPSCYVTLEKQIDSYWKERPQRKGDKG